MSKKQYHLSSPNKYKELITDLGDVELDGSMRVTIERMPNTRTAKQNRALHKYLTLLSKALNDSGHSFWGVMLRRPMEVMEQIRLECMDDMADAECRGAMNAVGRIMEAMPKADLDWTMETAKEHLWRTTQLHMVGKESTTKPERGEYSKIYEYLNRITSNVFGVSVPWPERDE